MASIDHDAPSDRMPYLEYPSLFLSWFWAQYHGGHVPSQFGIDVERLS